MTCGPAGRRRKRDGDTFLFLDANNQLPSVGVKEGRHGRHDLLGDELAPLLRILVQQFAARFELKPPAVVPAVR